MRSLLKYLVLFLITIVLMIGALVGAALIPGVIIRENCEESAEQLIKKNTAYYNLMGGAKGRTLLRAGDCSKIDQIADIYLLSIAYYLDSDHPLESVMWARYYDGREDEKTPLKNMNESFYKSVMEDTTANKQYLRYWHGSLIFVRPLLIFMNLNQMKVFFGTVICVLLFILYVIFLRQGLKAEALSFTVAMGAVSIWFVPISIEYVWTFIIMLGTSITVIPLSVQRKQSRILTLMMLTGMLTAYFDFFTTETITIIIPLLLSVRILYRDKNDDSDRFKYVIKCISLWGMGYAGCWTAKWAIAALIFKINTIPYVQERFLLHLGVNDEHDAVLGLTGAVLRNLSQLFPFGYGVIAAPLFFLIIFFFVFLPIYRGNVVLKKNIYWKKIICFMLLGLLVYVRFMVLRQHSWRHYFFTYRAQAASVLALCFIVLELVESVHKQDPSGNHAGTKDRT